ncbi:unnamed protein product [Spodoptera littoralis]|uniref:Peptidase S1 domain-containing protein n=1 Tax=Spodoptera littoralis TaxID=7109 RepID=A0A9P0I8Y3_SPOLI|nr:unnamed protein product [Spodoptera littoralis]CAH1641893.1 unnamed protein product [Spodoptera littoralis]
MRLLPFLFSISSYVSQVLSSYCGIDRSPTSHLYMSTAKIEDYPWFGLLSYPIGKKLFTTSVVLVTRQMALASADEIDKLPKEHFRAQARVIIGRNCRGESPYIRIREYTYHSDFFKDKVNALAMIQLETDHISFKLQPICGPPMNFQNDTFYAMLLDDDCQKGELSIYKMKYVPFHHCKSYYRRTGLDFDTLWPSHTTCAQSVTGGECVWRSGALLVTRVDHRWRLLGFGVYGPGCQAPARFLDYGMYHKWVKESFEDIGKPSISTVAENHLVMRRTFSKIQRFGECDKEEKQYDIFTDETEISKDVQGSYKYNLTLVAGMEYSCMEIKAQYPPDKVGKPKLMVRRWCAGDQTTVVCYSGTQFIELNFYVEIDFDNSFIFQLNAYGQQMKVIDPMLAHRYRNARTRYPPRPKIKRLWGLLKNLSRRNVYYKEPKYSKINRDHGKWAFKYPLIYLESARSEEHK